MMGELSVTQFLRDKLGEKPGNVVWNGEVIGTHRGLWFATIGQRGGWEINPSKQTSEMPPLYVAGKDTVKNQLIVGEKSESMRSIIGLMTYDLRIGSSKLQKLIEKKYLNVRIRNLGELVRVNRMGQNQIEVCEPVFAPAEGQSAVFYDEAGRVVGGAIIGSCI